MNLNQLLGKSISEMTIEELEESIHKLKKVKFYQEPKTRKTNKEHQLSDMLQSLTKEQLLKLASKLEEEKK